MILFTDTLPIRAPLLEFIIGWTAYFCITQLANVALGRGYYRIVSIEVFDLPKMFAFIRAMVQRPFARSTLGVTRNPIVPTLGVVGVYLAALAVGLLRLTGPLGTANLGGAIAAMVWAAAVGSALAVLSWRTYQQVNPRASHRLPLNLDGWWQNGDTFVPIRFRDLSLAGVAFEVAQPPEIGAVVTLMGERRLASYPATVRRVEASAAGFIVGAEAIGPWLDRLGLSWPIAGALFADQHIPELRPATEILHEQEAARTIAA